MAQNIYQEVADFREEVRLMESLMKHEGWLRYCQYISRDTSRLINELCNQFLPIEMQGHLLDGVQGQELTTFRRGFAGGLAKAVGIPREAVALCQNQLQLLEVKIANIEAEEKANAARNKSPSDDADTNADTSIAATRAP